MLVVVQDDKAGELGGRRDEQVGDRRCTVLAASREQCLDADGTRAEKPNSSDASARNYVTARSWVATPSGRMPAASATLTGRKRCCLARPGPGLRRRVTRPTREFASGPKFAVPGICWVHSWTMEGAPRAHGRFPIPTIAVCTSRYASPLGPGVARQQTRRVHGRQLPSPASIALCVSSFARSGEVASLGCSLA